MSRPCRAAKGLECVFPIWFTHCGRVWFTLAIPRPCHPRPCPSSQGHGTAWPSRDCLWANWPRSASSDYHAELHEVVIRRIPVSDADGQCETKHRLIFEVPFITLNSEMIPTRCNNCVYSSQWLYSTCFGWQFYPSSGVQCCMAFQVGRYTYVVILSIFWLSYLCRSCWVVGNTVLLCSAVSLNAEYWERETARHNKTVLPTTQHDRQR